MASNITVRFRSAKEYELVKKAAKSDSRSINTFILLASVDRAKAVLALQERIVPARNRRAEDEEAAS